MWEFIGLIVLIAIIFGVSLHNAFWGLFAFVVGLLIMWAVLLTLSAGATKLTDWAIKFSREKLTKKQLQNKCKSALSIIAVITIIVGILTAIAAVFSLILYGDLSLGFGH